MKKLNWIVAALFVTAIVFVIAITIKGAVSDDEPSVATTTPPITATTPPETTTPPITVTASPEEPTEPILPPITGEQFEVVAPIAREKLTFTIDTVTYTHEETEYGKLFYETEDGTREVFIEIVFVPGNIEDHKYNFLENYLPDATSTEYGEDEPIASSRVTARMITATGDGQNVDGWLIKVEGGFLAVVTGYKTMEQGEYIYRMLSTIVFEP